MKKILIVDDDDEVRLLGRKVILKNFNDLSVVMGINGEDGWREFRESQPVLVVTDQKMEAPDAGIQLAKKIKNVSPDIPVIVITGETVVEEADVVDCILSKPIDITEFAKTVKKFLRKETER